MNDRLKLTNFVRDGPVEGFTFMSNIFSGGEVWCDYTVLQKTPIKDMVPIRMHGVYHGRREFSISANDHMGDYLVKRA